MRLDSGLEQASKAGSFNDEQIIKQKDLKFDVPYRFRVLPMVLPVKKIMYPCLVADKENGGKKSSWRSIRLPHNYSAMGWKKESTVLDIIEEVDLKVRRDLTVGSAEKVETFFKAQNIWVIPVIDRRDVATGKELEIKYFEVGRNILDALTELQKSLDSDDQTKLAHGPVWVHDIIVRKKKKKDNFSGPDWMNTKYTVESYKENQFAGKIDSNLTEANQQELFEKAIEYKIFSEDEKAVVDIFGDGELMVPQYAPMSPHDIKKLLTDCPIDLMATKQDNITALFPDPAAFVKQLAKNEIAYMAITSDGGGQGLLPEPSSQPESAPAPSPAAVKPEPEPEAKLDPVNEVKASEPEKVKSSLPSFMQELDD